MMIQKLKCEFSSTEAMTSEINAASNSTQMLTDSISNGSFVNTFVEMANEQGATALVSANMTVDPMIFVSQAP